jgi:GTPase Era involved in 16S rRNA processing
VGKSTLMNALLENAWPRATSRSCDQNAAKAVSGQEHHLVDTPGMLWPKIARRCWRPATSARNALIEEEAAAFLAEELPAIQTCWQRPHGTKVKEPTPSAWG